MKGKTVIDIGNKYCVSRLLINSCDIYHDEDTLCRITNGPRRTSKHDTKKAIVFTPLLNQTIKASGGFHMDQDKLPDELNAEIKEHTHLFKYYNGKIYKIFSRIVMNQ